MQSRPNDLALVSLGMALLSMALLPWLGCSQKSAEVAAAPVPAAGAAPAPKLIAADRKSVAARAVRMRFFKQDS